MEVTALLLSRDSPVSHHLSLLHYQPGGVAAVPEVITTATGDRVYREVFEFSIKIFCSAFRMGTWSTRS